MPKMQLVPLVLYVWGAIFIGLSAGSVMQHQLQLVDKMDKGLDKVLSFCEIGATTAPTSKGWVETIMSYLSPKALFGYFVTGLILFFIVDTINKLAQGRAKEVLDGKANK